MNTDRPVRPTVSRPTLPRPALSRPARAAVGLAVGAVLAAVAVATPVGAFAPPGGQATTPAPPAAEEAERGPVGAAPPASPVPGQPRFTG